MAVVGRLDLFASEELERVWRTIPDPRRILLDLSAVTELSAAGGEALARLLGEAERCLLTPPPGGLPVGVVLPEYAVLAAGTDPAVWLSGERPVTAPTVPVTLDR